MRARTVKTRYRFQRWMERFEEIWDEIAGKAIIEPRNPGHLQSIPSGFSERFSRAVDRYLKYTAMLDRDEEYWWHVYFFGPRALCCSEMTSADAWKLAVDFPGGVDDTFLEKLMEYASIDISKAQTSDALLLESERVLSLLRLWEIGMDSRLMCRIAPQSGERVFSAVSAFDYADQNDRCRTMKIGIEHCLEIYYLATKACAFADGAKEDNDAVEVDYDAALLAHQSRREQLNETRFAIESQLKLEESQSRTLDLTSWKARLKNVWGEAIFDSSALTDTGKARGLDETLSRFIDDEINRNRKEMDAVAKEIIDGKKEPTLAELVFIIRNLGGGRSTAGDAVPYMILGLSERDRAFAMKEMALQTLSSYII